MYLAGIPIASRAYKYKIAIPPQTYPYRWSLIALRNVSSGLVKSGFGVLPRTTWSLKYARINKDLCKSSDSLRPGTAFNKWIRINLRSLMKRSLLVRADGEHPISKREMSIARNISHPPFRIKRVVLHRLQVNHVPSSLTLASDGIS